MNRKPSAHPAEILAVLPGFGLPTDALKVGRVYPVLFPGTDGQYMLTADEILQHPFKNALVVLLAQWPAVETSSYLYISLSMPMVLRQAGAGPVFAVQGLVPDGEGEFFFGMLLARIRAGQRPAVALRDVRMIWLNENTKRGSRMSSSVPKTS
jgi:hypothetical protein